MTDGSPAQGSAFNGSTNLGDVRGNGSRISSSSGVGGNASGRDAVEVLTPNGNAHDERGQLRSKLLDGSRERCELIVEVTLASRGPETEEKGGILGNGSWNCRDHGVCSTTLNHGVKSGTGKCSIGASELLGRLEFRLEVGLNLH